MIEPPRISAVPSISVIIATYNRCSVLEVTLKKLAVQSLSAADYEVLVVDDGSPDDTSQMVKSLEGEVPYRLDYLHHENRGPGYTQNRGIKEARGRIVVLIADDIWPEERFLEEHLATHRANPGQNIAVLGKVVQSPELPSTSMHKHWDPFRYDRFEGQSEIDSVFFFACNISLKRDFLLKHGMYKERKGAAHEDIELGYRLGQKGLKILYDEQALAYHYHVEDIEKACRRAYERGQNFDMLSENMPKPFIFSLYHICSLEAGMGAFLKMLPRDIPRRMLFNRWSINIFWLPILQHAETHRWASIFANPVTYRGTVHWHQRKGYADKRRGRAAGSSR